MLSYQHAYHAGNRADVLKHAVLDAALSDLSARPGPLLYVETHAGRGHYDLTGPEARKTGEAALGVVQLLKQGGPKPLRAWLDRVRASGLSAYPGSPALAATGLGPAARFVFFEQHPAEHRALEVALGADDRVQIKRSDGYAGALRLAPRRGERMCVFVDPSYETAADMEALADWAPRALRRWPGALVLIWLPLFKDAREADLGAYLADLADGVVAGARWPEDPSAETALDGSAVIAFRASPELSEAATRVAISLQSHWSQAR